MTCWGRLAGPWGARRIRLGAWQPFSRARPVPPPPPSVGAVAAAPSRPFADCEVFLPRAPLQPLGDESTKPRLIPLAWLEGVCALHNSFGVIH